MNIQNSKLLSTFVESFEEGAKNQLSSAQGLLLLLTENEKGLDTYTLEDLKDCFKIIKVCEDKSSNEKEEVFKQIALKIKNLEQVKRNLEKNRILQQCGKIEGFEKELELDQKKDEGENEIHLETQDSEDFIIPSNKEYFNFFHSGLNDDPLSQLILWPFKEESIQKYIHSYYTLHKNELDWEESRYWETLSKLPDLLEQMSHPFILSIIMRELPQIAEKNGWEVNQSEIDEKGKVSKHKSMYEKMSQTQAVLYDLFIEAWIKRKTFEDKCEENKFIDKVELSNGEILTIKDFLEFNQMIANDMLTYKTTEFKIIASNSKSVIPHWEKKYLGNDEKSKLLRSKWLLKPKDKNTYVFLHKSLLFHFAAHEIYHRILSCSTFAFGYPLNEKLIVDDVKLLNRFVEQIENDSSLENLLVDLIQASRYDNSVEIAAANAITILNRAGKNFSGCDWLSGVRIRKAKLSGGYFSNANFSNADLRDVEFNNAVLDGVNFTGACMDGIKFGQLPNLKFNYAVKSSAYSPDGKWLAIGDKKGNIYLYDLEAGEVKITLKNGSFNGINDLCFSQNSLLLASGSDDGICHLWHIPSGKLAYVMKGHTEKVNIVRFSPNGEILASGGDGGVMRLWNTSSGKTMVSFMGNINGSRYDPSEIVSIAFSPNGKLIALGANESTEFGWGKLGVLHIWEVSTGKKIKTIRTSELSNITFSPCGSNLISAQFYRNRGRPEPEITSWNILSKQKKEVSIDFSVEDGCSMCFSRDAKMFVTYSRSGDFIQLWDVFSKKKIRTFQRDCKVNTINFSYDNKTIAIGNEDGSIQLLDISTLNLYRNLSFFYPLKTEESFSKIGLRTNELSEKELKNLSDNVNTLMKICSSPNGELLASIDRDGNIRVWEGSLGKEMAVFHYSVGYSTMLDTIGSQLEGFLEKMNLGVFEDRTPYVHRTTLSFSPTNKLLASLVSSMDNGFVQIWDLTSKKELTSFALNYKHYSVEILQFNSDEKILAVGIDKRVQLRETSSGKCLYEFRLEHEIKSLYWDTTNEESILIIGDSLGEVSHYFIPKDFPESPLYFYWSNRESYKLRCKNTNIMWVTGLSPSNRMLLKQHGAKGEVMQVKSEEIMQARDDRERVGESCTTVFGRNSEGGEFLGLTEKCAAVSVAHKRVNQHVFVIIEYIKKEVINGVEKNKRIILKAEVFLDENEERKPLKFFRNSDYEVGFGYAFVRLKEITKKEAETLAQECNFCSEPITKDQVDQLLILIKKDAENTHLKYNNFGSSSIMSPFYTKNMNQNYGNCLTYAEGWLNNKTGIGVRFVSEENWQAKLERFEFQPVISSAFVDKPNDRSYLNEGKSCLIQ